MTAFVFHMLLHAFHAQSVFANPVSFELAKFAGCGSIQMVKMGPKIRLIFELDQRVRNLPIRYYTLSTTRVNGTYATESLEVFKSLEISYRGRLCLEGISYRDSKGEMVLVPTSRQSSDEHP